MSAQRGKRRERVPVTEAALSAVALAYLDRVPASRRALTRKLEAWVVARGEPPDVEAARLLIDALLERYERSRLIDDSRLAENVLGSARAKGQSRRAIEQRLATRGVARTSITQVLDDERRTSTNAEFLAAVAFVRRRRLGPHRPEAERAENRRRDLAALARAGFDFDTAIRALGAHESEEF